MSVGEGEGRKTPLYERHLALGARMIEFAGWAMPVEYSGIINEHLTVRQKAGLFDLSHMGELKIGGSVDDAGRFLDWALTRKVSHLQPGEAAYSPICKPDGGIVDDVVVYRRPDHFLMVVNAANREKDTAWLQSLAAEWNSREQTQVVVEDESDQYALIAIQGPGAAAILQQETEAPLESLASFHSVDTRVSGYSVLVSRTGYTGEDGFEIYLAPEHAEALWDRLLEVGEPHGLVPVGLGARDTLRMEARFPLYGNDIDETTNPLEAGLKWTVDFSKGDFVGRDALLKVDQEGIKRRLVGLEMVDRGIPRKGYEIFPGEDGPGSESQPIGHITSGTHSPSLDRPIGLGYVAVDHARPDTPLRVDIRGRLRRARVIKGRFIPSQK